MEETLTTREYQRRVTPLGSFVLIEKDQGTEQRGGLFVPTSTLKMQAQYSSTGVIIALSDRCPEDPYEAYLWNNLKVGDRVGFNATVPLQAPMPPFYAIKNEDNSLDASIIIHISDIIAVISESEKAREAFEDRCHD